MKKHWLVVYGGALDRIRAGDGRTAEDAMNDAYGMADNKMSAIILTHDEIRSAKARVRKICEMLVEHRKKFIPKTKLYEQDKEHCKEVVEAIDEYLKRNMKKEILRGK